MALVPPYKKTDFERVPEGRFKARCFKIIDLGSHENKHGQVMHKIRMYFELPECKRETGEPHVITKSCTFSLHEKSKLRPFIESWRAKSMPDDEAKVFDVLSLIGKTCMLTIEHNEEWTNILGNPTPFDGSGFPPPHYETSSLVLTKEEFDEKVFETLNDSTKEYIKESPEYHLMFEE